MIISRWSEDQLPPTEVGGFHCLIGSHSCGITLSVFLANLHETFKCFGYIIFAFFGRGDAANVIMQPIHLPFPYTISTKAMEAFMRHMGWAGRTLVFGLLIFTSIFTSLAA